MLKCGLRLVCSYPDYEQCASGLQYKDLREGSGESPSKGNTVIIDWDGYTIGYYGKVFEARNKVCYLLYDQLFCARGLTFPSLLQFIHYSCSRSPVMAAIVYSIQWAPLISNQRSE